MATRRPKGIWGRGLQRSVDRMTRNAWRVGRQVLASSVAAAPRKAASAARVASAERGWTHGVAAFGAVVRRWRLYTPPALASDVVVPLVVMLHGCDQDAAGLAATSRMNKVAAREGFFVLYPEQDRLAHPHGCWRWYDTRTGMARAEAGTIVAAVDAVLATHRGIDRRRIAIAGLSAGAGMAAFVAVCAPGRFAAVAMHSGIGPGAAESTATALAAMQGRRPVQIAPTLPGAAALPPLLVIQGSADTVVQAVNGAQAATAWATALSAAPGPPRTVRRGARHPMRVTDFRRDGRVRVTLCEIDGLGHAWSGGAAGLAYSDPAGPDAARLIWAFVSRQFDGTDTSSN